MCTYTKKHIQASEMWKFSFYVSTGPLCSMQNIVSIHPPRLLIIFFHFCLLLCLFFSVHQLLWATRIDPAVYNFTLKLNFTNKERKRWPLQH